MPIRPLDSRSTQPIDSEMSEQFQCPIPPLPPVPPRCSPRRAAAHPTARWEPRPTGGSGAIVSLELPPASLIDEQTLAAETRRRADTGAPGAAPAGLGEPVVILPRRGTLVADLNAADLSDLRAAPRARGPRRRARGRRRATPRQLVALDDLVSARGPRSPRRRPTTTTDRPRPGDAPLLAQAAHNELLEALDWLYSHVLRLWNVAIDRVG